MGHGRLGRGLGLTRIQCGHVYLYILHHSRSVASLQFIDLDRLHAKPHFILHPSVEASWHQSPCSRAWPGPCSRKRLGVATP